MVSNDFNPRAPCGARHGDPSQPNHKRGISIHAPRVGRDSSTRQSTPWTTPFQSTRPVWGATDHERGRPCNRGISIHAPRVGRDCCFSDNRLSSAEFQSTRPVWGATLARTIGALTPEFQSTRPVWGATIDSLFENINGMTFQSTRPVWGATLLSMLYTREIKRFQSTRPVWGATSWRARHRGTECAISIHAPRVGRDVSDRLGALGTPISIHAPRVGRDWR